MGRIAERAPSSLVDEPALLQFGPQLRGRWRGISGDRLRHLVGAACTHHDRGDDVTSQWEGDRCGGERRSVTLADVGDLEGFGDDLR